MASIPNLQMSSHVMGNPILQYQLLLQSLLLPMMSPRRDSEGTQPEVPIPENSGMVDYDDYLRLTSLSNQLAITQLNKMVKELLEGEANCVKNNEEENTAEEEEQQRTRVFQSQLLNILAQGFRALNDEMNHTNALIISGNNTTVEGQESLAMLQRVTLAEVTAGFNATAREVIPLRELLDQLSASHTHGLQGIQEIIKDVAHQLRENHNESLTDSLTKMQNGVAEAMSEGFVNTREGMDNLTQHVENFTTMVNTQSGEALELAQVTATGLLKLQAEYNNMTERLEEFIANFDNFSQIMLKEKECEKPVPKCPADFSEFGDECFYVSKETEVLHWLQARKFCRGIGGDLAQPSDPLTFILAVRENAGKDLEGMWVGGEELEVEVTPGAMRSDTDSFNLEQQGTPSWQWLSGVEVDHGWLMGQPSLPAGVNPCLTVTDLGFKGNACDMVLRFVCKYTDWN